MKYFLRILIVLSVMLGTIAYGQTNIALGKKATASSLETTGFKAEFAVDGKATTRWSSKFYDNQWIQLDLGAVTTFQEIRLNWQNSYAVKYRIFVSDDGENWELIHSQDFGVGNIEIIELNAKGRYIKINCISRFTKYGFSLWELEVYGDPTPLPGYVSSSSAVSSSSVSSEPSIPEVVLSGDTILRGRWAVPTQRVNGQPLLPIEIGGYYIRFRNSKGTVVLEKTVGGEATSFEVKVKRSLGIKSTLVAVFDKNGLYSDFVPIAISDTPVGPPKPKKVILN